MRCPRQVKKPNEHHGMVGTPEYRTWDHMIQRCTNPNNASYKGYGGRGIEVCQEWRISFLAFYKDMGERPKGMSIERTNNDGDYEPSNCKWATPTEQALNKRIRKDNSSGFRGVYFDPRPEYKFKKWYAEIRRNGVKKYLGHFCSPREAYQARVDALETR